MDEQWTYRNLVRTDDLVKFEVVVKETDLLVRAESNLSNETRESVLKYRHQLETYITMNPEFQRSLIPLAEDLHAPELVREMIRVSQFENRDCDRARGIPSGGLHFFRNGGTFFEFW